MLVDHYSPRLDGVQLSFAEFFATAVLSTIFMFVFETPTFAQIQGAAVSIAYCGILSSGVAYTLQIVGQKELDPTLPAWPCAMESDVQLPWPTADFGPDPFRVELQGAL